MKKLCRTAFRLLLIGIAASAVLIVANAVISFVTLDAQVESMVALYESWDVTVSEESLRTLLTAGAAVALVVGLGLEALWMWFIFTHKNSPAKGTYLTVMLVLQILGAVFGFVMLVGAIEIFNALSLAMILFGFALNGVIIAGVIVQRKAPVEFPAYEYYPPGYYPQGYYPPPQQFPPEPEPPEDPFE